MKLVSLIIGAVSFVATVAVANENVGPQPLSLSVVEDHGNGCPSGSYTWDISSDSRYLRIFFREFSVTAGQQNPAYESKSCRLGADFNIPAGFAVGIDSLTVRGNLEATDRYGRGRVEADYRWERDHYETRLMSRPYTGPYNNEFTVTDSLSYDRIAYSACSNFDQRQRLELSAIHTAEGDPQSLARLSENRFDRAIVYEYRLTFQRCSGPNPPPPPPPAYWRGSCRSILETIWGTDIRSFNGFGTGYSRSEAIRAARIDGFDQCERARGGDNLTRCIVDDNSCTATQQGH